MGKSADVPVFTPENRSIVAIAWPILLRSSTASFAGNRAVTLPHSASVNPVSLLYVQLYPWQSLKSSRAALSGLYLLGSMPVAHPKRKNIVVIKSMFFMRP